MQWVDVNGNPVSLGGETTASTHLESLIPHVKSGETIGNVDKLYFRDRNYFCAGRLHQDLDEWEELATRDLSNHHDLVLQWIRDHVSISPFFRWENPVLE